jgi:cytochrome d ubiquinol oxidase subunit II
VFGVAIGNVLLGVNFSFDNFMIIENKIGFFELFTPFSLLCGLLSVSMLTVQGACFLSIKTEGDIQKRLKKLLNILPFVNVILFAIGGLMLQKIDGYIITKILSNSADSNPLNKEVSRQAGAWFNNYSTYKWFIIAPILGFAGQIFAMILSHFKHDVKAFIASSLSVLGIISTVGLTCFPFILPSSLNPNSSLTVWDASSSYHTLVVMFVAAIIFVPLIISYTSFVFMVLRGKVNEKTIDKDSNFLY